MSQKLDKENAKMYVVGWHNKTASFLLAVFNTFEKAASFQKKVRNELVPNGSDYDGTYISEVLDFSKNDEVTFCVRNCPKKN